MCCSRRPTSFVVARVLHNIRVPCESQKIHTEGKRISSRAFNSCPEGVVTVEEIGNVVNDVYNARTQPLNDSEWVPIEGAHDG